MGVVVCTCFHEVAPHGAAGFWFLDGAVSVPFAPIFHFGRHRFCVVRGIGWGEPVDRLVAVQGI